MAQASSDDPRIALGAAILAASGGDPRSLKGPLFPQFYDPIEYAEQQAERYGIRREDDLQFIRDAVRAIGENPGGDVLIVVPTRPMLEVVKGHIQNTFAPLQRVTREGFVDEHGTRVDFTVDCQEHSHGRRYDEIVFHEDISWRTYVALAPCQQPRSPR